MNPKSKKNLVKIIARIVVMIIIIIAIYMGYTIFYKVNSIKDIFKDIETSQADITEYIIYGTHLNIKGVLDVENSEIEDVSLYFKTINQENEIEIDLEHKNILNGIEFYTSELINKGIDLEKINPNTYYIFVKIKYADNTYKYYSLKNETEYNNLDYYTITKNNKNNKIDIKFAEYSLSKNVIEYLYMGVNYSHLPDEVYDIVIDPGHRRSRCWS